MDPSVKCKYILTPCRTFGLQRTKKRTPGSEGSTPHGGNDCSLKAPFRSPLIANGNSSTPLAEKKSSITPKPSWSTPLLPKSRVRMGLSKPSPKAHPFTKIQAKSLIQTDVRETKLFQSESNGSKRQSSCNKVTAVSPPNHPHNSILQSAKGSSSSSLQSNQCAALNISEDSKSDQSGDESTEVSKEMEPPTLHCKKAQFMDEFLSCSESDNGERNVGNTLNGCSIGEACDSSSSQESFHGWDLENDKESMDCDSKSDLLQKCITNLKSKRESREHCGPSESKEFVPIKRCSQTNKLSFVKEKFRSKRRLMSDSDDSNSDTDGNFSIRRKLYQKPNDSAAKGLLQKKLPTKKTPDRLASSDSDASDDAQSSPKVDNKSNVPSSSIATGKCCGSQPDSEKENSDVNNLVKDGFKNARSSAVGKTTTKSRRRVLSESDNDDNDIGLSIEAAKKSHISSTPSEGGNVELGNETQSDTRLLSYFSDDDCGATDIQDKSYDTCKSNNVTGSALEREESYRSETSVKAGYDEDAIELGNTALADCQSLPGKDAPTSYSDGNFPGTPSLSKRAKMDMSSEFNAQEGVKVNAAATLITNLNGNHSRTNKPRSKKCVLSDSDDDSFNVKKPPEMRPRNQATFSSTPLKDDAVSSKIKLVVELCRLPESALCGDADEGLENSSSSIGRDSSGYDDIEEFSIQNHSKTYGRATLKKGKNVMKKPRRLSYVKQSLDKSGEAKLLSSLEAPITLQNISVKSDEDNEIGRRYLECISENEDLERMKGEMQRWLVGGQQVISQIIQEVRRQRDKDMSVMEVLQEHNIDPNLVGYDPTVEEFLPFDKFLLKNNLT